MSSYTLTFRTVDSSNKSIAKPFDITITISKTGNNVVWTIPQFNFVIPSSATNGAYLQAKVKCLCNLEPDCDFTTLLGTSDSFITFNTDFGIPLSNETALNWSLTTKGKIKISSFENLFNGTDAIQAGGHTILSTSFSYETKCEESTKSHKQIKRNFNLQLLDTFGFQYVPNSIIPFNTVFHQHTDTLFKVSLPQLIFTSTADVSPENGLGFSLGNFITTYDNVLPDWLKAQVQDRIYVLTGTYNDGVDPISATYAFLYINIYGQIMVFSTPTFWFSPGTYTFNPIDIWYDIGINSLNKIVIKQQIIQSVFSDISQWPQLQLDQGYRDTNVNDSAHNFAMFSFVSAANAANLISNTFTARADLDSHGNFIKIYEPVNLDNNTGPLSQLDFDASVAISRTHPKIVIATYSTYTIFSSSPLTYVVIPYYKISIDGGKSFGSPIALSPPDPSLNLGDYRGVIADKYGNFWLNITWRPIGTDIANVYIYLSRRQWNNLEYSI